MPCEPHASRAYAHVPCRTFGVARLNLTRPARLRAFVLVNVDRVNFAVLNFTCSARMRGSRRIDWSMAG
jgi:hypothetical protein